MVFAKVNYDFRFCFRTCEIFSCESYEIKINSPPLSISQMSAKATKSCESFQKHTFKGQKYAIFHQFYLSLSYLTTFYLLYLSAMKIITNLKWILSILFEEMNKKRHMQAKKLNSWACFWSGKPWQSSEHPVCHRQACFSPLSGDWTPQRRLSHNQLRWPGWT